MDGSNLFQKIVPHVSSGHTKEREKGREMGREGGKMKEKNSVTKFSMLRPYLISLIV